ncbi:MAG: hypothetical protein GXO21_07945 [Aquificae bacterium]|nr:hypothetical protein [Aquificota bacterium]
MQIYTIKTTDGYFTTTNFKKAIEMLKKDLKKQKRKLLPLPSGKPSS